MPDEGAGLTWPHLTATLLAGTDLTRAQTAWAMERVMTGEAGGVPLAGFLVALKAKGETGHILLVEQDQELAQQILAGFQKSRTKIDHAATLQQAVDRCLIATASVNSFLSDRRVIAGSWLFPRSNARSG